MYVLLSWVPIKKSSVPPLHSPRFALSVFHREWTLPENRPEFNAVGQSCSRNLCVMPCSIPQPTPRLVLTRKPCTMYVPTISPRYLSHHAYIFCCPDFDKMEPSAPEEMWAVLFVLQVLVWVLVSAVFIIVVVSLVDEPRILETARVWGMKAAVLARRWQIAGRVRTCCSVCVWPR